MTPTQLAKDAIIKTLEESLEYQSDTIEYHAWVICQDIEEDWQALKPQTLSEINRLVKTIKDLWR